VVDHGEAAPTSVVLPREQRDARLLQHALKGEVAVDDLDQDADDMPGGETDHT
jgi:hypothetical protein